jgi:hypothetical protein
LTEGAPSQNELPKTVDGIVRSSRCAVAARQDSARQLSSAVGPKAIPPVVDINPGLDGIATPDQQETRSMQRKSVIKVRIPASAPFAMAFSTRQQATQEVTLPVLRAHFCDANAAEFDLNKRFLISLKK